MDLSLADALVYLFNRDVCLKDTDELQEQQVKLNIVYDPQNRDYTTVREMARRQAYQQLQLEGEVFIATCFKMLNSGDSEKDKTKSRQTMKELFRNFFGRIKLCGMNKMTAQAISCLMANLPFEQALSSIVGAAVQNMSLENFGKLFVGLPANDQRALDLLVKQKLESGELFTSGTTNQKLADFIDTGGSATSLSGIRPWEDGELLAALRGAFNNGDKNLGGGAEGGLRGETQVESNTHTKTLAKRYQDNTTSKSQGTPIIMALYVESLIEYYSDNLLSIVDELNKFPGSEIIAKTLTLLDCPQPNIINPPVLDFIKDLEMPFCRNIDDITLPVIRNPFAWIPEWKDITGAGPKALKLALQEVLVSVLMRLMVKICNLIGSSLCTGLKSLGQSMASMANPNNPTAIADTIRSAICGDDANEEQVQDTVSEMFEKLGLGAAAMADQEQVINFAEDVSSSLTRTEMMDIFLGEASLESLIAIDDLIENEYQDFRQALPSTDAIANFFESMGFLFPADFRDSMRNFADSLPSNDRMPANPSLCATPEQLDDFCEHRSALLKDRATEEQIQMLCSNYQDDLAEKLDDLANALQGDPIANAVPPIVSDPGCDNGIVPFESEQVVAGVQRTMDATMKQIHLEFSKDMLGNGPGERNWGMINMIMSDTLGNPLTYHYRRSFNRKNYVDFYTVHDEPFNIDAIMGWDAGAQMVGALMGLAPEGQFPYKVADYLQDYIVEMGGSFDTNNNFREAVTKEKSFESLNLSLYGGASVLEMPDFGYNTSVSVDAAASKVYITRHGRKLDPDLEVEFLDNNKGMRLDEYDYLYGFNLKLFLSEMQEKTDENGQKVVTNLMSDNARINITNLLNFNADITRADIKNMTREQRQAYRDSFSPKEPSIQKERIFEFVAVDDTFDLYTLTDYPKFQESFYGQQDYMPQTLLLHEIIEQQQLDISLDDVKSYQDVTMGTIFSAIKTQVSGNEAAFMYGATYDELTEDDIAYVVEDGQTDSSAGTLYSDATINGEPITNDDAILGVSAHQLANAAEPEKNRVYYLDPATYGGNYINPPIYIKPIKNQGWMGFIDVLFPDLSPCKPSHTDLIDFGEISDEISQTYNSIPMDERLTYDEDCVVELPYNRILERHAIAGIEGIVKAACKIYSSVHFVKSIASFTTFKPDFKEMYSSLYPQYVVENMERAFKEAQGALWEYFNPFKDEEFWYAFLEQAVQTYGRLVDDGQIVDPPQSVLNALFRLNDMQEKYYFPTKDDWRRSQDLSGDLAKSLQSAMSPGIPGAGPVARVATAAKVFADNFETYKEFKERTNFEAIKLTEEDAKLVLKEMVAIELDKMSNQFLENLKQLEMEPKYTDVDYYILSNFTQGGQSLDLDKEIIEIPVEEPSGASYGTTSEVLAHVHTYEVDEEGNGWAWEAYHPSQPKIHHKHRITNWEMEAAQSDCYPDCADLYGVEGVSPHVHNISPTYIDIGDVDSYGESTTMWGVQPFILEKYIKINGVKYGIDEGTAIIKSNEATLNISDVYPGTLEQLVHEEEVISLVGELGVQNGLQFSAFIAEQRVEIASVEVDALDYEIQAYVPVQANSKELLCLINLLKKDEKFRLFTRYIIPTNKLLSVVAIYNDMAFLPSIGELTVGDGEYENGGAGMRVEFDADGNFEKYDPIQGWAHANDRQPSGISSWFVREWDYWDQELLRNSKSTIKSLFKTYYNARSFDKNIEMMEKADPVKINIKNLKDAIRPSPGESLMPRFRRGKIRSNPFDSKGKLCEK